MLIFLIIAVYACVITVTNGTHFLGGTTTWRPLNASATGTPVAIVIIQTTSWNYTLVKCNNTAISNGWPVSNLGSLSTVILQCVNNCGSTSTGYPNNVSVTPICIGFSASVGITVGQRSDIVYLASNDDFTVAFMLGAWRSLATVIGANWSLAANINVEPRSDNGLYNSAPVATVMSPINIPYNQTIAIDIPVADADGDTLRCRWATNTNGIDECGGVCPPSSLPPYTDIYPNCTIIITGFNMSDWYAIAIMLEDFINSTSTTPLSSVPVQFLIQVVTPSTCAIPPEIIGIPGEQSCTSLLVGQTFTSQLIAINNCGPNVTIIDISTLSFVGVTQGSITKQNSTTYYTTFTWTATSSQLGYQVMCAMAVDSQSSQSSQYCFKFYVSQNAVSDCPVDTTTTTTTTSTTASTSTTATVAATATTALTTIVTATTAVAATTTAAIITAALTTTITEPTTNSISATTSIAPTITSIIINTNIMSTSISTTLSSTTSISSISTSSITSTSGTTTTAKQKDNPIIWPLIGVIGGLFLLAVLTLCCCLWWHYVCPLAARSYSYKNDRAIILHHIEGRTDPSCDWPNRTSSSYISSLSSSKNYRVHTYFDDRFTDNYIKLRNLSSISTRNTENKSKLSSFPSSRVLLLPENHILKKKNARIPVSTIRVGHKIYTIENPGIKPPKLEINEKKKDPSFNLEDSEVSRVSWLEKPRRFNVSHELPRNSIYPLGSYENNQSRNGVQVTRGSFVSSDTISQSTMNDTCFSKFEDTIYSDDDNEIKTFPVNITDWQFKRSPAESISIERNNLFEIDQSEIIPITSKSKSLIPVGHSYIRVDHIPRTMKNTIPRNSLPSTSVTRELGKKNGIYVKYIS